MSGNFFDVISTDADILQVSSPLGAVARSHTRVAIERRREKREKPLAALAFGRAWFRGLPHSPEMK